MELTVYSFRNGSSIEHSCPHLFGNDDFSGQVYVVCSSPRILLPPSDPSVGALNTVERETPQFLRVIYMVGEFSVDFLSSGFQVFVFVFFP